MKYVVRCPEHGVILRTNAKEHAPKKCFLCKHDVEVHETQQEFPASRDTAARKPRE